MFSRHFWLSSCFLAVTVSGLVSFLSSQASTAQSAASSTPVPSDGKPQPAPEAIAAPHTIQEAYVIQQFSTEINFENDGTETHKTQAKIQVLSEAGVQHWGVISFAYQNFNQTLTFNMSEYESRMEQSSIRLLKICRK